MAKKKPRAGHRPRFLFLKPGPIVAVTILHAKRKLRAHALTRKFLRVLFLLLTLISYPTQKPRKAKNCVSRLWD